MVMYACGFSIGKAEEEGLQLEASLGYKKSLSQIMKGK